MPARVVLILLLVSGTALAAERGCERVLATGGRRLLARTIGVLTTCARKVGRGGGECVNATAAARARRGEALARRIRRACSAETVAALFVGGACAGARTPEALAACLPASHDADALDLLATVAPAQASASVRHCQAEAMRRAGAFALARLDAIHRCKRQPPPELPPGTVCADAPDTAVRIAARRAAAARRIAARCDASALAAARFGAPCAGPVTGAAVAGCLLDVAVAASDDAVAVEHADPSFCGDAGAAVEARVEALLARMTLDEKIAQMHGTSPSPGFSGRIAPNERLGLPAITMMDGPRGVGILAGPATSFPVGAARGATWDPSLEERVGEAMGGEARAKGADMLLAPTINLLHHPRWGRAQETYGEDTMLLGRMAVGFVRGAQRHVIANPKHFALNSIENTRFSVNVTVSERTLREVYLPHFRMAVQEAHAGAVMSAYNKVDGAYCGENPHLLHDVLKGDWGFRGFVESDWILGTRSTVPAAMAGLDAEMPSPIFFGDELRDAVTGGVVPEATVDAAVRRLLRAELCFRLDSDPAVPDPSQVGSTAHRELAREVEEKAIVLLKNAGAALPLDRASLGSLVVVGSLAATANLGDLGSSTVIPTATVTPLDGIRAAAAGVPVVHVTGPPLAAADEATVAAADVVVVVAGFTALDEGEFSGIAGDRKQLGLPGGQDALVAAVAALNPRTIVVLEGSGAVTMSWLDDVAAVVMAWYPGQEGGTAIGRVLFGDVNPSGKLPSTFPVVEADLPVFDNVSTEVTYGPYQGYRHLDRNGVAPLFPFGFGLSYTSFAYANLAITPSTVSPWGRVRVTADVTNTGARAGDAVAELYVGYPGSRVERAVRDLKAFARVHLEPGETKTVPFAVRAVDLAYWDSATAAFVAEPLDYQVEVGSSSRDLPLTGSFAVRSP